MKIRKLRLQNFRGFEDKTFAFSDQFNVLIGDNGTGKTSILDALAIIISKWFLDSLGSDAIDHQPDDIRQMRFEKGATLMLEPQYPMFLVCWGLFSDKEFKWGIHQNESEKRLEGWDELAAQSRESVQRREAVRLREQIQKGKDIILPLITHYGVVRLGKAPQRESKEWHKPGSRLEGYQGCLDPSLNIIAILGWLKAQEAIALQDKAASGVFKAVKQAIGQCMENWSQVEYNFKEDDLIATSRDGSRSLPFRMLSDGERNMLAMVADIARRAAILNPHLEEQALAETPGIVLIDELDLHLHPRWQRRVVDNLRETFPKLQFIATTHSPFIIQALRPGELIDLDEGMPTEYENESIEDIAENVMGVEMPQRSKRYQEMMEIAEEYYRVLQQAQDAPPETVERLKKRLDELSAPFSDDMAYHAFLKMEREAAGLGEHES